MTECLVRVAVSKSCVKFQNRAKAPTDFVFVVGEEVRGSRLLLVSCQGPSALSSPFLCLRLLEGTLQGAAITKCQLLEWRHL